MKRIYGFHGSLFAPLLVALILLTSIPTAAKVHYRGFVEGGLGATTVSGESGRKDNGGGVKFGYMLATTHGIQWKNNFFGIGVGITPGYGAVGSYTRTTSHEVFEEVTVTNTIDKGCMSRVALPIYANWRYDFFAMGDWAPYIGIKIGYYMPISDFEFDYPDAFIREWSYFPDNFEYCENMTRTNSDTAFDMFVSLDFGIRKKITRNSGISFGLSIQTANNAKAEIRNGYDYYPTFGRLYVDMKNELGISVLAKVAFDF